MQVCLRDDSLQQAAIHELVDRLVQILHTPIDHERHRFLTVSRSPIDRIGGPNEQSRGPGGLESSANPPCQDTPRVVINDRLHIRFRPIEEPKHSRIDVPGLIRRSSPQSYLRLAGCTRVRGRRHPRSRTSLCHVDGEANTFAQTLSKDGQVTRRNTPKGSWSVLSLRGSG